MVQEEDAVRPPIVRTPPLRGARSLREGSAEDEEDTTKAEVARIRDIVTVIVRAAETAEAQAQVQEASTQIRSRLLGQAEIRIAQRAIRKAEAIRVHQSIVIIIKRIIKKVLITTFKVFNRLRRISRKMKIQIIMRII